VLLQLWLLLWLIPLRRVRVLLWMLLLHVVVCCAADR